MQQAQRIHSITVSQIFGTTISDFCTGPTLNGKTPKAKTAKDCHRGGPCWERIFVWKTAWMQEQSPSRGKCCLCGNNSNSTDGNNGATCFCIASSVTNWHQPLLIMAWNVYLRNSDTNIDRFLHEAFYTGKSERKEKLLLRLASGTEINGSGIRVSEGTKGENLVFQSN